MKFLYLAAVFTVFFTAVRPVFAKAGMHNGFITLNSGFHYGKFTPTQYLIDFMPASKGAYEDQLGGALGFDIGYQFFSRGKFIHGLDAVIGMSAGFEYYKGIYYGGVYTKAEGDYEGTGYPTLAGYISSTYSLGFHARNTRFMFDVLGIQLAFGKISSRQYDYDYDDEGHEIGGIKTRKTDSIFNAGINLPLGFRVITDKGFIIGFRHTLSFNCAYKGMMEDEWPLSIFESFEKKRLQNFLNYSMMFVIGFTFDKQ